MPGLFLLRFEVARADLNAARGKSDQKLAGAEGFELSTYGFGDRRSNQLS